MENNLSNYEAVADEIKQMILVGRDSAYQAIPVGQQHRGICDQRAVEDRD